MKEAFLSTLTASGVKQLAAGPPICALLGSGISLWDPTNLPTGEQLTNEIFDLLFRGEAGEIDDPLGEKKLKDYFQEVPFENIMERCPETDTLRNLVKELFLATRPNPVHEVFAESVLNGSLESIITTNYDCCLEMALAEKLRCAVGPVMGPICRIVKPEEVPADPKRVYFKIHGSSDDLAGETLVFRLQQEAALPPWKRSLLRSLLEGRTLLVIGYSGRDFEICPEIPLAKTHQVIWNSRPGKDLTAGARRVMDSVPGDRKSTRLNSSHIQKSRMPSSA